mgnify:CR=1 FL=1
MYNSIRDGEMWVSEYTIYDGVNRYRNGDVSCWPHHKEGKTVYLHYAGLKPTYQATIRAVLMDNLPPEEWYNCNGRADEILKHLQPYLFLSAKDEMYFDKATYPNGAKLPIEVQEKGREACRWLSFLFGSARNRISKSWDMRHQRRCMMMLSS